VKSRILAVTAAILSTACTEQLVGQKQQVLAKQSVFSSTSEPEYGGVTPPKEGGRDDSNGSVTQPPAPAGGARKEEDGGALYTVVNGEYAIVRYCSDNSTIQAGISPIIMSSMLTLEVSNAAGQVLCSSGNTPLIKSMILEGKFNIAALCNVNLNGQQVAVSLRNENGHQLIMHNNYVLYADNNCPPGWTAECGNDMMQTTLSQDPAVYEKCDQKSSPLFVDLRTGGGAFELTSPEDGILFDIQGERAKPAAHTPKRIGWFKNSAMTMLVLPTRKREVHGINQLFGDNTRGPDGAFADNGFAALAKYDSHRDGVIDQSDLVYKGLSLWTDNDLNGIAGPGEIMRIAYLGITSIDLSYDPNFRETDRFGNEVKYKSVVTYANGEMKLIYDLWFLTRN